MNPFRKLVPGTIVYVRAKVLDIGDDPQVPPLGVTACDKDGKPYCESYVHYFTEAEVITKAEAVAELRKALR